MSSVDIRGLHVSREKRPVLRGLDLALGERQVTAVLGPNGAGKSTLISAIAGLIPVDSGRVTITGTVAAALQSPGLAHRSARANVELALSWWGVPRAGRRARADDALAALNASHLASRRGTLLSGGEQRRVHLARALALDPDLLLLDEPFAGLDPAAKASLLEDSSSAIRSRSGSTIIVVHERSEAWALADGIVVLLDGQVAASGAPQQVLDAPPSAAVARFLGYDGEFVRGDSIVLCRAAAVAVSTDGTPATVTGLTRTEDGTMLTLAVDGGTVRTQAQAVAPAIGSTLRVTFAHSVEFRRDAVTEPV